MKNLVIVESPTKARTISRFLGSDYDIKASMGHLMDLPKSKLGVDINHNFSPEYEVVNDKKKIINELKKSAKEAELILLATDPDREGEAISSDIRDLLNNKDTDGKFKRIVFHEITQDAIEEALKHPRSLNEDLVQAQTARRVLDRLVGYKLSPLLWKKVRRGLSAGRVQSIALRLIVEREREIENFSQEQYFSILAALGKPKEKKSLVEFTLVSINNEKVEQQKKVELYDGTYHYSSSIIKTKEHAEQIIGELKPSGFVVTDISKKQTKRSPQPPFTTSTLQQEAARRFGFSGKRTMSLAQKLYEEGFITYHRTDSVNLAASAVTALRDFIKKTYGDKYIPGAPRYYRTMQKNAQEAHEAIRPTNISISENKIVGGLGKDYAKLYDVILKRAVASQMSDALIESTVVTAEAKNLSTKNIYTFKASGSVLVFEGFLKANPQALQDNRLPDFTARDILVASSIEAKEHETQAPPRYNDASLIQTLEEKGIGRPSTYATIISTIEARRYIERVDRKFVPTSIGMAVNDFLVTNFSDIDNITFTAEMENELDEIANGKRQWVSMMQEFYNPFEKKLETVEGAERVKIPVEKTDEKCPTCGNDLIIRTGRFGKFFACSTFPDCKFTKPFIEDTNLECPKDRVKIVIKKTKKGRKFYGCSNYPKCDFAAWKLEDIKNATT